MDTTSLQEIQEKIKDIIISVADFDLTEDKIDSGENGINKLGFNSLTMIKMLVEIEKEFDVEVDFEETDPGVWSSLGNLSNYILSSNVDAN